MVDCAVARRTVVMGDAANSGKIDHRYDRAQEAC